LTKADFLALQAKIATTHDLDSQKTIESINYLLNYYEFLALGARMGDLDEELLRQTLRSPFLRLVAELDEVITHYRGRADHHYGVRTLEHIVYLRDKWQNEHH